MGEFRRLRGQPGFCESRSGCRRSRASYERRRFARGRKKRTTFSYARLLQKRSRQSREKQQRDGLKNVPGNYRAPRCHSENFGRRLCRVCETSRRPPTKQKLSL